MARALVATRLMPERCQAKPTHRNIIRLTPPLVITPEQITSALEIIGRAVDELPHLSKVQETLVVPASEKGVAIEVEN